MVGERLFSLPIVRVASRELVDTVSKLGLHSMQQKMRI